MTKLAEKADHLDFVHDTLAQDEAGAVIQAYVEGHLDAPLSAAVKTLGKGDDADGMKVTIILNSVCRTLRDAYGREAYEAGVRTAQADLYLKGGEDVAVQLLDQATQMQEVSGRLEQAVQEVSTTVVDRMRQARKREDQCAWAGALGGMLGTAASFVGVLATLWYTGGVSFH